MSVYDTRYSTEAEESANADRYRIRPTVYANHPNNIHSSGTHAERLWNYKTPPFGTLCGESKFMRAEQGRRWVMRRHLRVVAEEPRALCYRPSCG